MTRIQRCSFLVAMMLLVFSFHLSAKPGQKSKVPDAVAFKIKLKTEGHNISFDKTEISVKKDQLVAMTYENLAAKDSEILHNVAIVAPHAKDEVFRVLQLAEYDLSSVKKLKSVLAISKSLAPGESDTIKFKPTEKGVYHYICLMPGHGDMLGMTGTIKVE
ncbi:MAG: cupredoxin domain-containing protein [Pseudobacteriovorax sp.]|nr:cupredoxin domain-containing protein [Pseudobacteriovorax sp.]